MPLFGNEIIQYDPGFTPPVGENQQLAKPLRQIPHLKANASQVLKITAGEREEGEREGGKSAESLLNAIESSGH